jgi:hypothetical protein
MRSQTLSGRFSHCHVSGVGVGFGLEAAFFLGMRRIFLYFQDVTLVTLRHRIV